MAPRLAFIGFGEAGQAIAAGLRGEGCTDIAVWDVLLPASERMRAACEDIGARAAGSAADAVTDADIIVAAVTAASSLDAAQSVAAHLRSQPLYLDVNSVSPGRKRETAALLGDAVRYLDVAILSPIHPARHRSPMLVAGPHADHAAPALAALGLRATITPGGVGAAAAIKMVRSVMIKGMEALTYECFVAAERAGITTDVAASLKNNYPGIDWARTIFYNLERMATHGERRAAEMEEVVVTLQELGIIPLMASATVQRQREMAAIGSLDAVRAAKGSDHLTLVSAISEAARELHELGLGTRRSERSAALRKLAAGE